MTTECSSHLRVFLLAAQVLVNLLTNACKYTAEGEITLSAEAAEEPDVDNARGVAVRFAVQDTGCGVPESYRNLIFDEFQQAGSRSVKVGTGLGLPLCRSRTRAGLEPAASACRRATSAAAAAAAPSMLLC